MRVAVVGSGIAGLTAARELSLRHEVHLFEADSRAGGHAHTVEVEEAGRRFPVDVGFIVYNERNYPVFSRLLKELEVETVPSSMGFSVSSQADGIEYSGESLPALFAAPANALRPDFWRMLRDFRRFRRAGHRALEDGVQGDLDSFCRRQDLSEAFRRLYLRPMAGAIWSTPTSAIEEIPAATLLRFFERHGLLSLSGRPAWRTVADGSRRYVRVLLAELDARIHLATPVERIERNPDGVELRAAGNCARFDEVVLAVHSDQALSLLADPSPAEVEILGAIPYQENEALLHTDASVLPRRRRAWASWNVRIDANEDQGRESQSHETRGVAVTYLMNKLQPLPTSTAWCVSLNQGHAVDPATVRARIPFAHPRLDESAVAAQARWEEIDGRRRTHFCGAYWRHGFHEDGAWSGLRAARRVGRARREAA